MGVWDDAIKRDRVELKAARSSGDEDWVKRAEAVLKFHMDNHPSKGGFPDPVVAPADVRRFSGQ